MTELWVTAEAPADNSRSADALVGIPAFRIPPPAHGSIFRVVDYPPDRIRLAALAADASPDAHDPALYLGKSRHPGFHKTATIDYAIVLSGEIWALMDEGEVLLKTGDVLVQRGTNHAWSNRTDQTARVAFVLIDAIPVGGAKNE
ncbi:MAG: cupin domain-containing protein [Betaproteobacteria bacterium]|nr:cupin domain-containing protein [Betaproteobacteria bacterium]